MWYLINILYCAHVGIETTMSLCIQLILLPYTANKIMLKSKTDCLNVDSKIVWLIFLTNWLKIYDVINLSQSDKLYFKLDSLAHYFSQLCLNDDVIIVSQ